MNDILKKYPPNPNCLDIPWTRCHKHGPDVSITYRGTECPLCKLEYKEYLATYRDDMNEGDRRKQE